MNLLKKALKAREATSALFLVALFVIVSLLNPSFASSENIAAVFNSAVVYILIAVGMAFAIIVGEIDVSVGSCLGFVATVVGSLLRDGCNWPLAFAVGILIGAVVGLINGWGTGHWLSDTSSSKYRPASERIPAGDLRRTPSARRTSSAYPSRWRRAGDPVPAHPNRRTARDRQPRCSVFGT